MKKLLSKLICLILVLCTCLSLVACGPDPEPPAPQTGVVDSAVLTLNALTEAAPNATDASKPLMLAENGSSNYKIVVRDDTTKGERYAADDLTAFIKESLGVTLKTIPESEAVVNDKNQYYISIGKTKILNEFCKTDETLVPKYEELKENGQLIAVRGNVIFITGYNHTGTYSAMVTFIEKELGFERFASDEYHIDKMDKQVVYNFGTFKYLPNVQFNLLSEGPGIYQPYQIRYQQRMMGETFSGGATIHAGLLQSYSHTLGTQILSNSDKDLFPNGKHLCMTNPRAPIALAEDIIKKSQGMKADSDNVIYEIGSADDFGRCKCSDCELFYKTHTDSEGYLKVLNGAAKLVREHFKNTGREGVVVYLMGLCYNLYEFAPTKYNEITEKYEPNHEDVYVDDWVMIRFTPIASCHGHGWNDPRCEANSNSTIHNANGWASLTDNMSLWTYGWIFHGQGGALMFPNFQSIQYLADYFEEVPYTLTRIQGSMREESRPFGELKDYMLGKMWYDNEYDYDALFEKFFAVYYREAGPAMRKYFDLTMANFHAISERKGYGDCIDSWFNNFVYDDKGDWDINVCLGLQACIDEAYEAIDNANYDEATKQKLRDRVCSDSIQHRYFLVADCEAYFSKVEYAEMRAQYLADCEKFGAYSRIV